MTRRQENRQTLIQTLLAPIQHVCYFEEERKWKSKSSGEVREHYQVTESIVNNSLPLSFFLTSPDCFIFCCSSFLLFTSLSFLPPSLRLSLSSSLSPLFSLCHSYPFSMSHGRRDKRRSLVRVKRPLMSIFTLNELLSNSLSLASSKELITRCQSLFLFLFASHCSSCASVSAAGEADAVTSRPSVNVEVAKLKVTRHSHPSEKTGRVTASVTKWCRRSRGRREKSCQRGHECHM